MTGGARDNAANVVAGVDPNLASDRRALVLDDFVADWLRVNARLRLLLRPVKPQHYAAYLNAMNNWATRLGLSASTLEEVLFAEAASERPRSEWAV